jgi:thiol-disulfide isomerase/thioredoxin
MKQSGLIALGLSAAAVAGYVSYRMLLSAPGTSAPAISEPAASAASDAAEPAQYLPDFSLSNLNGEVQSIHDWPGKALIINFWATWCPPCLREIPLLKAFQEARQDQAIQVIGIAVDRPDPVRAFVESMAFNYPVLIGQADAMDAAAAFGIDFFALPFTVFTDTQGNILDVHTGELHAPDLEELAAVLEDLGSGTSSLESARERLAGRR